MDVYFSEDAGVSCVSIPNTHWQRQQEVCDFSGLSNAGEKKGLVTASKMFKDKAISLVKLRQSVWDCKR